MPVPFKEVSILMCRLHTVVFCVVVRCFHDLSDHSVRRNIEDAVEMQSSGFSAALPYADVFPAFAGDKVLERIAQGLTEAFFSVLFVRKGESAKIAPFPL